MINRFHPTMLVDESFNDFSPSNISTPALTEFLSFKIGMMISYGMTSFTTSDSYAVNMLNDPPATALYQAPSVIDSGQWATEAKNLGCDYAVLTSGHHIGFNNFPYTGTYNNGFLESTKDSNRGDLNVPFLNVYDIRATIPLADQNIVGKFVDQCKIEGIKAGLYYNTGKNINIRRGLDLIDASYDQTNTFSQTYQHYIDFVLDELTWLVTNYDLDIIWLDAPHHAPRYYGNNRTLRRYYQDIYNTLRELKPNLLININYDCPTIGGVVEVVGDGVDSTRPPFNFDGTEMILFPSDIISFEYFRKPTNASDVLPITNHKGIDYYIPKEVVTNILDGGQYFARNDVFQPLLSLVTLQSKYDYTKANGIPLLLNVTPAKNGVIPSNQLTRFGEIVL